MNEASSHLQKRLGQVPNLKLEDLIDSTAYVNFDSPKTLHHLLGMIRTEIHAREANLDDVLLSSENVSRDQRLQVKTRSLLSEARERIAYYLKNNPL